MGDTWQEAASEEEQSLPSLHTTSTETNTTQTTEAKAGMLLILGKATEMIGLFAVHFKHRIVIEIYI